MSEQNQKITRDANRETNMDHEDTWEGAIAELLNELSSVQEELLRFLAEKQRLLLAKDLEGLAACAPREKRLIERLQCCHDRRGTLLRKAADADLPSESIRALTAVLETDHRKVIARQLDTTTARSRLLAHQSLANWVFVQRSLLHLSQLLEIIATGGRLKPTYGEGDFPNQGGSIVDQAA